MLILAFCGSRAQVGKIIWPVVQKRGGKGKTGGKMRENDAISDVLTVMSHDHLVCVATDGTCHTVRAFDVPERSRTAKGLPMGELLPKLKPGVTIATVVPLRNSGDLESHVMLLTVQGKAKRIDMQQLRSEPPLSNGPTSFSLSTESCPSLRSHGIIGWE
jgi:DNA gyrase/topoisomerase IV subunit A